MRPACVFLASLIFLSCVLETDRTVTLVIPEQHPFEIETGNLMWYTLRYFDGETIRTEHVDTGTRKIKVKVKTGGLRVFTLTPIDEFGSLGGFFEPGDGGTVNMTCDDGSFASMLINCAEYRPDTVSALSMNRIKEDYPDLSSVDEVEFMTDLFEGSLVKGKLKTNKQMAVEISDIPNGLWVSERYDVESVDIPITGRSRSLLLYPGCYHFANFSWNLLLSVILTEAGNTSVYFTALPLWY